MSDVIDFDAERERREGPDAEDVRELLRYQSFTSHVQWVNKAPSWLTSHPRYNDGRNGISAFRAVCFDTLGRQCRIGRDFQRADDEGTFPVHWLWPDQVGPVALLAAQGMPREAPRRDCGSGPSGPASPVAEGHAPKGDRHD